MSKKFNPGKELVDIFVKQDKEVERLREELARVRGFESASDNLARKLTEAERLLAVAKGRATFWETRADELDNKLRDHNKT